METNQQASDPSIAEANEEATLWRSVVDPASGKTYYYHIHTRESVWDKPLALCSPQEQANMARKQAQLKSFFAEMEGNIRRNIKQGRFFTDGDADTPSTQPDSAHSKRSSVMVADDAESQRSKPSTSAQLCRTISKMDESVLAELHSVLHGPSSSTPRALTGSSISSASTPASDDPIAMAAATPEVSVSRAKPTSGGGLSRAIHNADDPTTLHSGAIKRGYLEGMDSTKREAGKDDDSSSLHSESSDRAEDDEKRRALFLARRNSTSTIYLAPHDSLSNPDLDAAIQCVCAVFRAHMVEAVSEGSTGDGVTERQDHKRSVQDEMNGQHMIRLAEQRRELSKAQADHYAIFEDTPRLEASDFDLFRHVHQPTGTANDLESLLLSSDGEDHDGANARVDQRTTFPAPAETAESETVLSWTEDSTAADTSVPSLLDVTKYYRDLYHRAKLKFDCIVLSLIYVERLMKETAGALRPRPSNWKSLLMSALVLSSKVWDDNSMWNRDFSELCPSFTLVRINELEVAVLDVLKYNVKVLSSTYAKYYFHLRSMCVRGGLSDDIASMHPLNMEDMQTLEDRSSRLEDESGAQLNRQMKATTLHSFNNAALIQKVVTDGYAFTDRQAPSASLEQVVNRLSGETA